MSFDRKLNQNLSNNEDARFSCLLFALNENIKERHLDAFFLGDMPISKANLSPFPPRNLQLPQVWRQREVSISQLFARFPVSSITDLSLVDRKICLPILSAAVVSTLPGHSKSSIPSRIEAQRLDIIIIILLLFVARIPCSYQSSGMNWV